MGIYLFKSKALIKALDNECTDFGREIIPGSLDDLKVHAYIFNGYWQDIGTIKSFYDANISLSEIQPPFNFYDESKPILTRLTYLPSSKVNYCKIYQSLISEGCIITNADIRNSIVGLRMIVESNSFLDGVITMGNSYYENAAGIKRNQQRGIPPLGVGKNTSIKRTIIDNNARIGDNCRIGIDDIERQDGHYKHYSIIDGIIVVKQNGVIHHNTVI
jgi:glucose-1-phosphate adenylyltransferase